MAWSPLQELVTLDQAKQRILWPDTDAQDEAMQLQLEIAHELVMDVASQRLSGSDEWLAVMDTWTADTAPRVVLGAILAQFVWQWRWRGDDNDMPRREQERGVLAPEAEALIKRLKDPALA